MDPSTVDIGSCPWDTQGTADADAAQDEADLDAGDDDEGRNDHGEGLVDDIEASPENALNVPSFPFLCCGNEDPNASALSNLRSLLSEWRPFGWL